ncbi:hypothetical protein ANO11243_056620 [Dothideomycetidae sp. 11243]|nr:hypothetical protein ANO11243_056620 [fungal sp. No.11243]
MEAARYACMGPWQNNDGTHIPYSLFFSHLMQKATQDNFQQPRQQHALCSICGTTLPLDDIQMLSQMFEEHLSSRDYLSFESNQSSDCIDAITCNLCARRLHRPSSGWQRDVDMEIFIGHARSHKPDKRRSTASSIDVQPPAFPMIAAPEESGRSPLLLHELFVRQDRKTPIQQQQRKEKRPSLQKALEMANTATRLDQASFFGPARQAYFAACASLDQAVSDAEGPEERQRLNTIQNIYRDRIDAIALLLEPSKINEANIDDLGHAASPLNEGNDEVSLWSLDSSPGIEIDQASFDKTTAVSSIEHIRPRNSTNATEYSNSTRKRRASSVDSDGRNFGRDSKDQSISPKVSEAAWTRYMFVDLLTLRMAASQHEIPVLLTMADFVRALPTKSRRLTSSTGSRRPLRTLCLACQEIVRRTIFIVVRDALT